MYWSGNYRLRPTLTMARLMPGINFTGSLGKAFGIQMRGSDTIVLRRKVGASEKQIKNTPSIENTREWREHHVTWVTQFTPTLKYKILETNPINEYQDNKGVRNDARTRREQLSIIVVQNLSRDFRLIN